MNDFNFGMLVSKDVRERIVSLRKERQNLIDQLASNAEQLAQFELHVMLHDALFPEDSKNAAPSE